ncbi:MAG: DNA polymerase/3'-5' exonuclease PolX [Ignavibacteriales bacterium]|nr:DNA polymerase/3'-5' exonuclease PolX [Ignavibacteriales bacterium]
MDKKRVIEILDEIGTLLELTGENPFRSRAYHNGAQVVSGLTNDLNELIQHGSLTSIKGIGQGLADTITELMQTGKTKMHEELRAKIPSGVLEMLRIQGLGPKKIKILYEKLNIKSIAELREACNQQRLRSVEGFGAKTEENILKNIDHFERSSDKHLYPQAFESAERIISLLKKIKGVKQCNYAGSLRRRKEIIGDIDILVSAPDKARGAIMSAFTKQEDVDAIVATGDTKATVILKNGIQCDLRIVSDKEYPFALNYFTGSKEHNVEMRSLARKQGLSLNEYSFTRIEESKTGKAGKQIPSCITEAEIYKTLGLHYIPPELRENTGEIEFAKKHVIPKLIDLNDLRGTFHCHTTDSDGLNTLEQMVEAAKKFGWEYLGIADHSQAAAYAGGLSPEKVHKQMKQIDRMNEKYPNFRIFKGTECDILSDGSMDYNDKLLSEFDYVVASIHNKFKMTEEEATKRVIKALKNKYVTMLGHPTGRLLLQREGYPINMPEIIAAAADYGKAIEINAHPMRLDLDWRFLKYAKEKGVPIFINPDAHNVEGLQDVRYGVGIARKGWLEPKDVVNSWSLHQVSNYLKR